MTSVPFVDLEAQHRALYEPLQAAFDRVIASSGFILGADCGAFEEEMASYLGAGHGIGMASGTDAIHLALRALGIGPGDEVIVPSWTFIATAAAVVMAGARPVFADIDPSTFHLCPDSVRSRLSSRTRAMIPVHLYGQAMDLEPFFAIASEHGLKVVEDACQAHGARLPDGRKCGTAGDVGCFSFYPSKNLGGLGDGGMAVTDDAELAERMRALRHHGQREKNVHSTVGYTARLDGLQAALLRVKLPHLDGWNAGRKRAAAAYAAALAKLPIGLPVPAPGRDHVHHVYVIRSDRRDELLTHLQQNGIAAAVHYPAPIHSQPAFADPTWNDGSLAHSEQAGREVLSLPMFPEMTDEQVARVAAAITTLFP